MEQILKQSEDKKREDYVLDSTVKLNGDLIDEREKELENIEMKVNEVSLFFSEVAEMVKDQGVYVDNIENYIENSAKHTDKGVKELEKAHNNQSICIIS